MLQWPLSGALDDIGGRQTIDAAGMIVLPAGIEPHTSINAPALNYWAEGDAGVLTQPPESANRTAVRRMAAYGDLVGAAPR